MTAAWVMVACEWMTFRRDTIVTRGEAQVSMNRQVLTKGTFQRQLADLKKRIKTQIKVYLDR